MSVNRTVENGMSFPASVRHDAIASVTLCPCCPDHKKEKITASSEVDHILALQFAEHAETLEVTELSGIGNAGAMCGRCHFEKTRKEQFAGTFEEVLTIYNYYWKKHFTSKGNRRRVTSSTIAKHSDVMKQITVYETKIRLAKAAIASGKLEVTIRGKVWEVSRLPKQIDVWFKGRAKLRRKA